MRVTKLMIKPLALAVAITSLGVMNAQAAPKDPDKSTMAYEGTPSAVDAESAKIVRSPPKGLVLHQKDSSSTQRHERVNAIPICRSRFQNLAFCRCCQCLYAFRNVTFSL